MCVCWHRWPATISIAGNQELVLHCSVYFFLGELVVGKGKQQWLVVGQVLVEFAVELG